MTIPAKIKIGGLTYTVKETENITLGVNCVGEIVYDKMEIHLRPGAREFMERNLLHEIIHGIYDNLGYTNHEEKDVDELAGAIYALVKDNPKLFEVENGV